MDPVTLPYSPSTLITEQSILPSTSSTSLSRISRIGKNASYTSPLTEENLKLHTGMTPSPREAKSHHVLSYVDLQRQLIALEAQLRRETKAEQEVFDLALPENIPSVIPEVIHIPITSSPSNRIQPPAAQTTDDAGTPPVSSFTGEPNAITEVLSSLPTKSIDEIPTLLDSLIKAQKKSQRIKTMGKKIVKKLSFRLEKNTPKNYDVPPTPSFLDKDIGSLRVETSIPPSPSQSVSLRSRTSSNPPNTPLKRIFIPGKPPHRRADSSDTMQSFSFPSASPTSSPNNNVNTNTVSHSLPASPAAQSRVNHLSLESRASIATPPATPLPIPSNNNIININSNNNDENFSSQTKNGGQPSDSNTKTLPGYRDSGISFVSPQRHSREHSLSSLLRRVGAFQENHNFRKKEKTPSGDHEVELLAFRYPSLSEFDATGSNNAVDSHFNGSPSGVDAGTTSVGTRSGNGGGEERGDNSGANAAFMADVELIVSKHKERAVSFVDFDEHQVSGISNKQIKNSFYNEHRHAASYPSVVRHRDERQDLSYGSLEPLDILPTSTFLIE